jgi:hypothetical protein
MCRTSGAWKTETYTEYISRAMKHTIVQDGKTYEKQSGAWRLRPKTLDGTAWTSCRQTRRSRYR